MKKHIPNTITLLNLASGSVGLFFAAQGQLSLASWMIVAAAIFDLLDGMVARLLGVNSPIGKELDSLADVVSFGVLPAFILKFLLLEAGFISWLPLLVIPAAAALRLAKFNIDTSQTSVFKGLPSPAAAFMLGTWPLAIDFGAGFPQTVISKMIEFPEAGAVLASMLSLLMLIPLSMLSFKFSKEKGSKWSPLNQARLMLLLAGVMMAIFFKMAAFLPVILLYILISIWVYRPEKKTQQH